MAHRARSAFEVDGLRKEMGGGRKEGCLQRKWEQWPLSALFHPLPSLSVTYRKSTKGVWVYKYTSAERERTTGFLFPLHTYVGSLHNLFFFSPEWNPPEKKPTKKLPPVTKINHFLSMETHWGFWWREQVCVTKASLQPFPIGEECDVQKDGQACAVCRARIQALKLRVCFNG